jgi:uncharacterized protein
MGRATHLAAADLKLEPIPLEPDQIVEGRPTTAGTVLWSSADGRHEYGVWEITPGVATDVEQHEVFVVIAGRASIEIEDGPTLEVGAGDVGALRTGDRTTWRVTETLRKVYLSDAG